MKKQHSEEQRANQYKQFENQTWNRYKFPTVAERVGSYYDLYADYYGQDTDELYSDHLHGSQMAFNIPKFQYHKSFNRIDHNK